MTAESGRINRAWLETLIEDLLRLRKRGQQVILVSSGAIALGRRRLGLKAGALRLEESQAAAAVGQIRLAHAYKELLESKDVTVAQVLLTLEDSERRRRYLNARATLESCWSWARCRSSTRTTRSRRPRSATATTIAWPRAWRRWPSADCLVLLSDVDGLYSADPEPGSERALHPRGARTSPRRSRPWQGAPPPRSAPAA